MNKYEFNSKDGAKISLHFTSNFDVVLHKSKKEVIASHVLFYNCCVGVVFPPILRYCFEKDINLKERPFLRDLPFEDLSKFDPSETNYALGMPSEYPVHSVKSIDGNLVIQDKVWREQKIVLEPEDIAELVEGFLRILNCYHVQGAYIECAQMFQYYHTCLEEGSLKK